MVTTIGIKNLRIDCIIGVRDFERETPQPVFVDAELDGDFTAAADSEQIADTVDYGRVAGLLAELAHTRRFQLLETFASESARALLDEHSRVSAVRIEVRKPGAVERADFAFVRCALNRAISRT